LLLNKILVIMLTVFCYKQDSCKKRHAVFFLSSGGKRGAIEEFRCVFYVSGEKLIPQTMTGSEAAPPPGHI
jgi:hypothetical protein